MDRLHAGGDGSALSRAKPAAPATGAYVLVLRLEQPETLRVGRLGSLAFHRGFYLYVGSAMGSGGIEGRLRHHLGSLASPRWHIDYLRLAARLEEAWLGPSLDRREHDWARVLAATGGLSPAHRGFGSSDCACRTHLFYAETRPCWESFAEAVRSAFPYDAPVTVDRP